MVAQGCILWPCLSKQNNKNSFKETVNVLCSVAVFGTHHPGLPSWHSSRSLKPTNKLGASWKKLRLLWLIIACVPDSGPRKSQFKNVPGASGFPWFVLVCWCGHLPVTSHPAAGLLVSRCSECVVSSPHTKIFSFSWDQCSINVQSKTHRNEETVLLLVWLMYILEMVKGSFL